MVRGGEPSKERFRRDFLNLAFAGGGRPEAGLRHAFVKCL